MTKMITAVQLAKEMKLPPKRVRSILRKAGETHDGRWKFPASDRARLKALVRDSRKRATVDKAKRAPRKVRHEPVAAVIH